MIFISLKTSKVLTLRQENHIQNCIKKIISNYMSVSIMIHIEDDQLLYFDDDCMVIKCYVGEALKEDFRNRIGVELLRIVEEITCISIDSQCLIINNTIENREK